MFDVWEGRGGHRTRLSMTKMWIKQRVLKVFGGGFRQNNFSFGWLGKGGELHRLKHHTDLGNFDGEKFYQDTSLLERVTGIVRYIEDPGSGIIELDCGIEAFFVPSRVYPQGLQKGIDEYTGVSFYLGFSYSGLRAWRVRRLESTGQ